MPVADCSVDCGLSARVAAQRQRARGPGDAAVTTSAARRRPRAAARASPASAASAAAQHQAGGQADQRVVDERQRMRPFLDEAQAGIDHRGAVPEQQRRRRSPASGSRRRASRRQAHAQRQPPQRDHADERRQHDHLARQPRGAPHQHRAPGALGPAEVQERGAEADHAACAGARPAAPPTKPAPTAQAAEQRRARARRPGPAPRRRAW